MNPFRPLQRLRQRLGPPAPTEPEVIAPRPASTGVAHRLDLLSRRLGPHALRAAERLLAEDTAGRAQLALAQLANPLVALGFRLDPNARRLFDFLAEMEGRHGRERVLGRLLAHMALDPALGQAVSELARNFAQIRDPKSESPAAQTVSMHMGRKVLQILCELAALDHSEPLPETGPPARWDARDIEALVTYFESAPLAAAHRPLARMTQGVFPSAASPSVPPGEEAPGSALERRRETTALDETLHFVLVSYGFCLQILLLRGAIERLPDAFAMLRSRLAPTR